MLTALEEFYSKSKTESEGSIIGGVDVNLLLEDVAALTKRVAELEDDKDALFRILRRKFHGDKDIAKLLNPKSPNVKLNSSGYSVFGQEDDLTTERAIEELFSAQPVKVDPLSNIKPLFADQKGQVPRISLEG